MSKNKYKKFHPQKIWIIKWMILHKVKKSIKINLIYHPKRKNLLSKYQHQFRNQRKKIHLIKKRKSHQKNRKRAINSWNTKQLAIKKAEIMTLLKIYHHSELKVMYHNNHKFYKVQMITWLKIVLYWKFLIKIWQQPNQCQFSR